MDLVYKAEMLSQGGRSECGPAVGLDQPPNLVDCAHSERLTRAAC